MSEGNRPLSANFLKTARADFKSILFILGSFSFAWCLGLLVHESGHALAYTILGTKITRFSVHPFGLSYMRGGICRYRGKYSMR